MSKTETLFKSILLSKNDLKREKKTTEREKRKKRIKEKKERKRNEREKMQREKD